MKHIFITLSFSFVAFICSSQTFQATMKQGSLPNSVIIAVKPSVNVTNAKITTFYFSIAVPATVLPRPALNILTNFNSALGYTPSPVTLPEMVAGSPHYIYNFLADGQTGAGTERNYSSAGDNNMIELIFQNGPPSPPSTVLLVSLTDGGTSLNSYFNIYNLGNDVTHTTAMFYGGTPVNSASGYLGTSYTNLANVVLPVKFLGFNATKKDNNALLSWQIENESAITDRYEIERSLNGVDYVKFATVLPKNNGRSSNTYDLTDLNLSGLRASGVFYYRIKQFDKDGKFIYSDIKNLRLNSKGLAIGVYPNPVRSFANLTIDIEQDADATLSITDASGKQVQLLQLQLFKGPNIKKIKMDNLSAGSYMLKVQTATELKTMPVVKAN